MKSIKIIFNTYFDQSCNILHMQYMQYMQYICKVKYIWKRVSAFITKNNKRIRRKKFSHFKERLYIKSLPSDIRNENHFITFEKKINAFSFPVLRGC